MLMDSVARYKISDWKLMLQKRKILSLFVFRVPQSDSILILIFFSCFFSFLKASRIGVLKLYKIMNLFLSMILGTFLAHSVVGILITL